MKALVPRSYGSPDRLDLTAVDTPVPTAGEVLVRVRATSVNPYDWHHMRGEPRIARMMPGTVGLRAPKLRILGCDIAGQVEAVGEDVTEFRPGDDVFALLEQGGFAEYVSVPERLLARKPGNSFAVQIARALGARADAVCSSPHADLVRSIGADNVIDYAREDFTRSGRRYDVLLDIAGGRPVFACRRVLTAGGTQVLVGGPAGRWLQPAGHVFAALAMAPLVPQRIALADAVSCTVKKQILMTLTTFIEDGTVTPVISRTYPFHDIREAIRYQERGHVPGKVVVTI